MKESKELQRLMEWNQDFSNRVFPEHSKDPKPPLYHLKQEVAEIIEAIETGKSEKDILEEYSDALILLTGSAIRIGFTAGQLLRSSFDKMEKNEKRDWGEPDENGVYNHKK